MLRRQQSAGAPEQASPSESNLPTPSRELFGAQLAPARDLPLDVEAGHIGGVLFSVETVESVHVAYLATGFMNPLERILPSSCVHDSTAMIGTDIDIVRSDAAINDYDALQQNQRKV
jgi:hypothetical protein